MGKVLIIDDEKQILGLLSRIIGLEGYEVLQAATCKAGLRQMEQHSPEVVLCDVFLPDGNGSPDKPGGLSIQLCKSEKKEFYIRYSS